MSNLNQFCYSASSRVMQGLAQELNIWPGVHYKAVGHNSARVLTLRLVRINPHYLARIRTMRDPLTMWAGLSDKTLVRIGQDGQAVTIEIPKPSRFWKQVTIDDLQSRHFIRRGPIATLGLGLQDNPERINFSEPATAHTFITGQTRSGKTNTQKLIAWNLAHNTEPASVRLLIFDVAKRGYRWQEFNQIAHLFHPLIIEVEEANRVLCWLTQEIERRAEQRRTTPRLFIIIDELKALTDDSEVATGYLARLASTGGEFGLHLILATQYSQIKLLGSSELKRNITTRLCGRVDDSQAAINALGLPDSGAETLQGYGDFLLRDFRGLSRLTIARIQARYIEMLPHSEIAPLDLPDMDVVYAGQKSMREPDPLEPEQIAMALFNPMGINRLAKELGIGSTKAKRIKTFADRVRQWAIDHGHDHL